MLHQTPPTARWMNHSFIVYSADIFWPCMCTGTGWVIQMSPIWQLLTEICICICGREVVGFCYCWFFLLTKMQITWYCLRGVISKKVHKRYMDICNNLSNHSTTVAVAPCSWSIIQEEASFFLFRSGQELIPKIWEKMLSVLPSVPCHHPAELPGFAIPKIYYLSQPVGVPLMLDPNIQVFCHMPFVVAWKQFPLLMLMSLGAADLLRLRDFVAGLKV